MKQLFVFLMLFNVATDAENINQCKRGWNTYQQGEYVAAIKLFEACIAEGNLSQSTLARTYRNMGIVANGSHKPQKALNFYDQAIALNPEDIWFDYVNMGNAFSALNQYDQAINNYKKAFKVKPNFNQAYYNMGLVYDKKGETENAIKNYKLALDYGLNSGALQERINHHNIQIDPIEAFKQVSTKTEISQYIPAAKIDAISSLTDFTCGSGIRRNLAQHVDHQIIQSSKSYQFKDYGIKFKLPKLPFKKIYVADSLYHSDRGVKDSYLLISKEQLGEVVAAVVVTEFPDHLTDQVQLMNFTKQIESSLSSKIKSSHVLVRHLESDFGLILEQLVFNRVASYCFPTSEFAQIVPDSDKTSMGISRFIYDDNIMIELALIVEKPKTVLKAEFAEYARNQMNQFWSGLSLNE